MSNIEELQRRIATAMDRVAQGVEQMGNAAPAPDPETAQALEDERTANAQLSERIRTLKTKSETEAAARTAVAAAHLCTRHRGEARLANHRHVQIGFSNPEVLTRLDIPVDCADLRSGISQSFEDANHHAVIAILIFF